MLTELYTLLNTALGSWLPLAFGIGGPGCIYLQARATVQVAEINGRYSKETAVEVARIAARAQVEVARIAAGVAEVPKVTRKRWISTGGTADKALERGFEGVKGL